MVHVTRFVDPDSLSFIVEELDLVGHDVEAVGFWDEDIEVDVKVLFVEDFSGELFECFQEG